MMMPAIQLLDPDTVNQIAAGEVVERPSSVVKELLENAVDAGATAVTVETQDGGLSFIRVTDNGCGIVREEVALAFLAHSTSKIRSAADLAGISSLGFRGEALSSIAAVSQMEVITKTQEAIAGTRYRIEGGKEIGIENVGAPQGTTFLVKNLFFNTPARRKFLKTPATEGARAADIAEKLALSHPELSLRLIQNGQNRLHTSGNGSVRDLIYAIYGRETAANLIEISHESEALSVRGYIGKPEIARNSRSFENYFINGRYIRDRIICRAAEEAFKPFLMQHKYPFLMLYLTVDPGTVDVNVHPAKLELRFRNGDLVFRELRDCLKKALANRELIPALELDAPVRRSRTARTEGTSPSEEASDNDSLRRGAADSGLFREPQTPYGRSGSAAAEPSAPARAVNEELTALLLSGPGRRAGEDSGTSALFRGAGAADQGFSGGAGEQSFDDSPAADSTAQFLKKLQEEHTLNGRQERTRPGQLDLFTEKLVDPKLRHRRRLIGQAFGTYWMIEFQDKLYLVDQHAAHEKVLYEQAMRGYEARNVTTQAVSPPVILSLTAAQESLLTENAQVFSDFGFVIEHFGGREYAVRGVPTGLLTLAAKDILTEMLDSLSEAGGAGLPGQLCAKAASLSCRAAVKGNHELSREEAESLLDQLFSLENPYNCPHGRPVMISISRNELDKKFGRIL